MNFSSDIHHDFAVGNGGCHGWGRNSKPGPARKTMAAIQRLAGKTAIVTASTAGIGFAIARRLARGYSISHYITAMSQSISSQFVFLMKSTNYICSMMMMMIFCCRGR
jgi:hypothetical protein